MQHYIEHALIGDFGVINLNLVGLRKRDYRRRQQGEEPTPCGLGSP